jgi:threonine synthase
LRAVRAATETGGAYVTVSDDEILRAVSDLGLSGVFAEPAGAAAYAGFLRALADGVVHRDDPMLVLNTGTGLKDTNAAMRAAGQAPVIEPTLRALKDALKQ